MTQYRVVTQQANMRNEPTIEFGVVSVHETLPAAQAECARLAAKHQDVFYVFRVTLEGCMLPQEPEWRAA